MEQVEIEIEYIPEQVEFYGGDLDAIFRNVVERFIFRESVASDDTDNEKTEETAFNVEVNMTASSDSDEEKKDEEQKEKSGISNRKKKLERRMKIADLKKVSSRPDIVEVWDVTSADPKLLVFLKSYRNTVPVPRHWCQKKRFLQGKRGIEKQPFKLPDFIAATGIENIRQAYLEQKKRNQKMGKMDIDYQELYDAFFKYQTKPKLTSCGDLYYEGKEFEVNCREIKRGTISHKLKEALGMAHVDEFRRRVYGNVFGQQEPPSYEGEPIDRSKHWGDLDEDEEEVLELKDGIQSVESLTTTQTGVETPDVIGLRKKQRKEHEKPLYQVLEEKEAKTASGILLGTTHTYVIDGVPQDKSTAKRVDLLRTQKTDTVNVSLQPDELEVLDNVLPAKYEKAREEEKLHNKKEDLSDMVADFEKKRKWKMQEKDSKSKKKAFRF